MTETKRLRMYLVVGESGAGKSSFIKSLSGVDKSNKIPEVGGRGDSKTKSTTPYWAKVIKMI